MNLNHIPAPIDSSLLVMPPTILDSEGGGDGIIPDDPDLPEDPRQFKKKGGEGTTGRVQWFSVCLLY